GVGGMALLIPFTHAMDAHTALAFLIGMWAVTATADTVPAILFGVPGAVGSAATVLDGHPMAKRGEAGRAFGASFSSSIVGGLFGAILLAVAIPILRPFMLAIGTPELFAVCVLGLTLVASVSQGNILKGLIVALFGVLLAAVGDEAQSGQLRWTFDTLFDTYLLDGVPIECIALGLFAVPELMDMAISRANTGSMQRLEGLFREQMLGVRDVVQNWKLILNSSFIGVVLGSVPGMGAAVIDWIAYGSAARMIKGASETFGKGDVRGLIAAESANCSREGRALIPTLAVGAPGAPSMGLLLSAFLARGIAPGPKLLDAELDITYTLVWSLALANVVGAGICFMAANPLARIASLRAGILIPTVLAVCFVGAYQGSRSYGDLVMLVVFGFAGWTMKRHGWARAADPRLCAGQADRKIPLHFGWALSVRMAAATRGHRDLRPHGGGACDSAVEGTLWDVEANAGGEGAPRRCGRLFPSPDRSRVNPTSVAQFVVRNPRIEIGNNRFRFAGGCRRASVCLFEGILHGADRRSGPVGIRLSGLWGCVLERDRLALFGAAHATNRGRSRPRRHRLCGCDGYAGETARQADSGDEVRLRRHGRVRRIGRDHCLCSFPRGSVVAHRALVWRAADRPHACHRSLHVLIHVDGGQDLITAGTRHHDLAMGRILRPVRQAFARAVATIVPRRCVSRAARVDRAADLTGL